MGSDQLHREIEALRERLSRLSAASRHINESLDVDTALRAVMDSARAIWPWNRLSRSGKSSGSSMVSRL